MGKIVLVINYYIVLLEKLKLKLKLSIFDIRIYVFAANCSILCVCMISIIITLVLESRQAENGEQSILNYLLYKPVLCTRGSVCVCVCIYVLVFL